MADGRHYEKKSLNIHISATVRLILMKFGMVTNIGPLQGIIRKKFEFLKIQDSGGRHLENHKKSRYLRNGFTDLYKIWYDGAKWVS